MFAVVTATTRAGDGDRAIDVARRVRAVVAPFASLHGSDEAWSHIVARLMFEDAAGAMEVAETLVAGAVPVVGSPDPARASVSMTRGRNGVCFTTPGGVAVRVTTDHVVVQFPRPSMRAASAVIAAADRVGCPTITAMVAALGEPDEYGCPTWAAGRTVPVRDDRSADDRGLEIGPTLDDIYFERAGVTGQ